MSVDWSYITWLVFRIRYEGQGNRYFTVSLPTDVRLGIERSVEMLTTTGALSKRVEQQFGSLEVLQGRSWEMLDYVVRDDDSHKLMFPKENAEIRSKSGVD